MKNIKDIYYNASQSQIRKNKQERLSPKKTDEYYIPLSDLRLMIDRVRTSSSLQILDFGALNSPYSALFPNSVWKRADIYPLDGIDYIIDEHSKIKAEDDSFDFILSTQVCEHLPNPDAYFKEAFRLLKPGGTFFVSTHGIWEEHGAPYDFQRWTADGLRRDLEKTGFRHVKLFKLTTDERFFIFHALGCLLHGSRRRRGILAKIFRKLRRILGLSLAPCVNLFADYFFDDCRIVAQDDFNQHIFYAGVASIAIKL